jgi:hypothetical protein
LPLDKTTRMSVAHLNLKSAGNRDLAARVFANLEPLFEYAKNIKASIKPVMNGETPLEPYAGLYPT